MYLTGLGVSFLICSMSASAAEGVALASTTSTPSPSEMIAAFEFTLYLTLATAAQTPLAMGLISNKSSAARHEAGSKKSRGTSRLRFMGRSTSADSVQIRRAGYYSDQEVE